MFTGLVEEVGRVERVEATDGGVRLTLAATRVLEDARVGDSVAVSGCCLTVAALRPGGFVIDAVPETLARTTLGAWRAGRRVNLERALRLDQRIGGHLTQGHVDGVGWVRRVAVEGEGRRIGFELPAPLRRFVAEKGSIAIDGVSLTVAARTESGGEIANVPHTLAATTAADYAEGDGVHVEVDLIARYVARWLEPEGAGKERA